MRRSISCISGHATGCLVKHLGFLPASHAATMRLQGDLPHSAAQQRSLASRRWLVYSEAYSGQCKLVSRQAHGFCGFFTPASGTSVDRAQRYICSCPRCSRLSGCRHSATAHLRSCAGESSDQDGTARWCRLRLWVLIAPNLMLSAHFETESSPSCIGNQNPALRKPGTQALSTQALNLFAKRPAWKQRGHAITTCAHEALQALPTSIVACRGASNIICCEGIFVAAARLVPDVVHGSSVQAACSCS